MKRGLRRVSDLLRDNPKEAARVYQRAMDILERRSPAKAQALIDALEDAGMPDLTSPTDGAPLWVPLMQAHDLAQIGGASDEAGL